MFCLLLFPIAFLTDHRSHLLSGFLFVDLDDILDRLGALRKVPGITSNLSEKAAGSTRATAGLLVFLQR